MYARNLVISFGALRGRRAMPTRRGSWRGRRGIQQIIHWNVNFCNAYMRQY